MRIALAAVTEKPKTEWDIEAAIATYNVDGWGSGYFTVNAAGNAEARPLREAGGSIDILAVVNEARARGLGFPLVIRFQDLLRDRVQEVNHAFQAAMTEFGYRNTYRGVFPIKVNQRREVIEEIVDAGQEFHFGLEAGSKPELIAALAMHKDLESLIICKGYKDRAYIRSAMLGCRLGTSVILVVENIEEREQNIRVAKTMGVEPQIGSRVRLPGQRRRKPRPPGPRHPPGASGRGCHRSGEPDRRRCALHPGRQDAARPGRPGSRPDAVEQRPHSRRSYQ